MVLRKSPRRRREAPSRIPFLLKDPRGHADFTTRWPARLQGSAITDASAFRSTGCQLNAHCGIRAEPLSRAGPARRRNRHVARVFSRTESGSALRGALATSAAPASQCSHWPGIACGTRRDCEVRADLQRQCQRQCAPRAFRPICSEDRIHRQADESALSISGGRARSASCKVCRCKHLMTRHIGSRVAASESGMHRCPREIPHLRLPVGVVGGIHPEDDGCPASGFLE